MSISLEAVSTKCLAAKELSGGTRNEYRLTITKWLTWGDGVDVGQKRTCFQQTTQFESHVPWH
jgi:hypothetical protein